VRRFLYLCGDEGIPVPGTKGASIHVAAVCRALVRAGMQGEVLAARAEASDLDGVPLRPLGDRAGGRGDAGKCLRGQRPVSVPTVRPDFIYERYSLWHTGGLALARSLDVPFILEVNSPLPAEAARYRALGLPRSADGIAELLLTEADGIVCVSEEVAQWVHEQRRTPEGVWVIPNGVDLDLFASAPRLAAHEDDRHSVAFCGSFKPWHGLDDLLEAFDLLVRRHRVDARLLAIGDGPGRPAFEESARQRGLADCVTTTGRVPHEEVPVWLARAEIAVAPYPAGGSSYFSPLKAFECMAAGLPLIGAEVGQLRELLSGGRGRLYPAGDTDALAAAMADWLRHPADAQAAGRNGRDWVVSHAGWTHRVDTLLNHVGRL
jgi:glycosyltransferase involved in cell wall biosynthesis